MTSWDAPVLAIDIGTSAVKCGLAGGDGSMATASQPVATRAAPGGVHEVDAGDWLRAVAACIGALGTPPALTAVVVTGNGPTVVPAGADGRPLHPAITWLDRRSGAEVALIAERTGPRPRGEFLPGQDLLGVSPCPGTVPADPRFRLRSRVRCAAPHRVLAHGARGAAVSALLLGRRPARRARPRPRQVAAVRRHRQPRSAAPRRPPRRSWAFHPPCRCTPARPTT